MPAKIDFYSWEEVDAICKKLAASIHEEFDLIVCIMRGGAVPAVILANELDIKQMLSIQVMQGGQISGAGEDGPGAYVAKKGVELSPLNPVDIRGKRVLVVDDVLDSGESVITVMKKLKEKNPALLRLAVMQKKDYSRIEPDYYVEVKHNWLFYPWMSSRELGEMMEALSAKEKVA